VAQWQMLLMIDAKMAEDHTLEIKTVDHLLTAIEACLIHTTYNREAHEEFYNLTRSKRKTLPPSTQE